MRVTSTGPNTNATRSSWPSTLTAHRDRRVYPRMPGNPGGAQAEGRRRDRRAVGPVHPARRAWTHPFRQWHGVHCHGGADWIAAVGATTAYIAPGSPWENGFKESFNARLRDELLDGEIFYTLRKAQIVIESWRRHYNAVRPHASIGYQAPAPEVFVPALAAWPAAQPRPAPPAMLPLAPRPALH